MGPVWCVRTDHLAGHSFTLYRLFEAFSTEFGRSNGKPINGRCPRAIYGIHFSTFHCFWPISFIIMCVPCENNFYRSELFSDRSKTFVDHDVGCVHTCLCLLYTYFWFYSTFVSSGPTWPTWWWDVWPKAYMMEYKIPTKYQRFSVLAALLFLFFVSPKRTENKIEWTDCEPDV